MKRSKKLGSKLIALMLALMMVAAYVPMVGDVAYADTATSTITTDATTYEKGDPVYVTATSSVAGAWVALSSVSDAANSYWVYYNISDANGVAYNIFDGKPYGGYWNASMGMFDATDLSAGQYRIAVLEDYDGNVVGAETTITIEDPANASVRSLELEKENYVNGDNVRVKATSYSSNYPWVGLYYGTEKSGTAAQYYYTSGRNGTWYDFGQLDEGTYTVVLCNDYDGEDVEKTIIFTVDHNWSWKYDGAANKTHSRKCVCDETETEDCSWDDGVVTQAPTEDADGVKTYTCSVCKGTYTEDIPAKEIDHEEITLDPTCYSEGKKTVYYTDGTSVEKTVSKIAHTFGEWVYNAENKEHSHSCTVDGCNADDNVETKPCSFDSGTLKGEKVLFTCETCEGTYEKEFLTTDKEEYALGDPINVTVNANIDGAWVGLYNKHDGQSSNWYMVSGNVGKTVDISTQNHQYDIERGEYVVRVVLGDDATIVAEKEINIGNYTRSYPIKLDKNIYDVGEPIMLTANHGFASDSTDWIVLFKDGICPSSKNYYEGKWYYLKNGNVTNGNPYDITKTFGELPEGKYVAHLLLSDTYEGGGYIEFEVHDFGDWAPDADRDVKDECTHSRACGEHADVVQTEECSFGEGVKGDDGIAYTCSVCEGTYVEAIVETGRETIEEATCEKPGLAKVTYSDGTSKEVEIPQLSHELTKTDANPATCEADGNVEYWTCAGACKGYYLDENAEKATTAEAVVVKAGHKLTPVGEKAATCEADGNIAYWACEGTCGGYYLDENAEKATTAEAVIIKGGHKLTKTGAKAATCEADGNVEYWTCEGSCGGYYLDENAEKVTTAEAVVIKGGHKHVPVVTEPTCTEQGYTTYTCECGDVLNVGDYTDAAGHKTVKTEAKAATCEVDGNIEYYTCEVCKKFFAEAEGKTELTADKLVVAATGHTLGEFQTVEKAGFDKEGKQEAKCVSCDYVEPKAIAAAVVPTLKSYTFNNKKKTPSVTVKNTDGSKVSIKTPYFYSKTRKSVGKYKVKVTLTGDNYSGYKYVYFKINPAKKSISKLTAGKKAFTVKWSKPSSTYRKQMSGYQIKYSTSSKMTSAKTVTVKGTSATSKTIKKLKAKKYYYVQIRTYKTVSGSKYYSDWSKTKKVKTK